MRSKDYFVLCKIERTQAIRSQFSSSLFLLVSIKRSTKCIYVLLKLFFELHSIFVKDVLILLLTLVDSSYKFCSGYSYNYLTSLLY